MKEPKAGTCVRATACPALTPLPREYQALHRLEAKALLILLEFSTTDWSRDARKEHKESKLRMR